MPPRALASLLLCLSFGCSGLRLQDRAPEPAPTRGLELLFGGTRQLTFVGRRSGEGYFSADGRALVFQSEREAGNPFFQIYWMDLESGESRRLSPGYGKATCAWVHPSGERVLFASTHLDPEARAKQKRELEERESPHARRYAWDFDEHYDLFATHSTSGQLQRLTRERGYDAEASYSPDGRRIVFASNRHAYREPLTPSERERLAADPSYFVDLYLMDADGKNVRRLTRSPGYDGGPFFSPDGRDITWRRFSESGDTAEIYVMNLDGERVRQLTRLGALSWAPFFHPSGAYVIFSTNRHGFDDFELYLVDSGGAAEPLRITDSAGFDGLPAFSPDGSKLVWTSTRTPDGSAQLFMAEWDHVNARNLIELRAWGSAGTPAELPAQSTSPAIQADDLRARVEWLAGEQLGGRLTGTAGEQLAADYVAGAFAAYGLEPAAPGGGYFEPFDFTAGLSLGPENRLLWRSADSTRELALERDWRPLAFSRTGSAGPAPVAFAGYGIVAPGAEGQPAYDSYADLDVAGQWVLVLRYLPEDVAPERRQHLSRFASLRYKAMLARERGAAGLLVASGPRSRVREQLVPLASDAALAGTSLFAVSVSDAAADALLASAGYALEREQARLDSGQSAAGVRLAGAELEGSVDLAQERRTGHNTLGRLRSPAGRRRAPLVIGAHVDHLGRGGGGDSLAREEEVGEIHYGADDNASGVAALLEIAEHMAADASAGRLALERDVIFAAWSGEELGLLGSAAFTAPLPDPANGAARRYDAYLNLDMVGRLTADLILHGAGSSPLWAAIVERRNAAIGVPISLQQESYLPTDATSFYVKGIPVLSAFTGSHEDYHTPRDTPDRLNYEGLRDVARLIEAIARELATRTDMPAYAARPHPGPLPPRAGLRAWLGTIPNYARTDVRGVQLAGVAAGGPAERSGVRAGDVVVALAGHEVENIYDYTYAIDALRIGEPVAIAVLRDGRRIELQITPLSRE